MVRTRKILHYLTIPMEFHDGCLLRCTFPINVYCIEETINKLVKEISMYTLKKGSRVFRNKSNYNSKVEI